MFRKIKPGSKPKILCILQLAPPVHGASVMNGYFVESEAINTNFDLDIIDLQFNKSVSSLKKFSLRKIAKSLSFGFIILTRMIQYKPNIVYFNLSTKGFAFYRDACFVFLIKLFKARIVFHLHSKGIAQNIKGSFLKRAIYRRVFSGTQVICLSEILTSDIRDVYRPVPYIVPNGIPDLPDKLRQKALISAVPRILYLSNYMKDKGLLVLIQALRLIKDKGLVFSAKLAGAPMDLSVEVLKKTIAENQLESCVTITGPMYGENKIQEFQHADIFVLPSFDEAFPLVLLEAHRSGLPVISTFEGGIPDLITDNENGLLVQSHDAVGLADKLSSLLNDAGLRKKIGHNGYEIFKNNFTLGHFEANMVKTLNDVIGH